MQKDRQTEKPILSHSSPARASIDGGAASLDPADVDVGVGQPPERPGDTLAIPNQHTRHKTPAHLSAAAPDPTPYTHAPARKNSNSTTSRIPTGPLVAEGNEDDALLPGLAGLPPLQRVEQTPDEAARSFLARRRLSLWLGIVVLGALLIIEVLNLAPWSDPIAGAKPREARSIPLAEVNPFGVNVFLHKEVDRWKKEKTLAMAQDMGAGWIKQQFPWAEIEFAKNTYWDPKNNQSSWDKFDNIVDLSEQRGLRIIARIDSAPDWAKADDDMPKAVSDDLRGHNSPPSQGHMVDFSEFIKKFVTRYRGRIAAIQIWNEPNLRDEWYPAVNAKDYVSLLQTAYIAAKSVDPDIIVLSAPLATNLVSQESMNKLGALNELDYLQAMYYAGAQPFFDAMSANAYGKELPPEDPPSRQTLNFRRVELLRQVMVENGDRGKAIWFNEYGWNASPDTFPSSQLIWGRVTPEQQADYTVRGIEYARAHWSWAGVFTIWYLRQVGDIPPTQSDYYFSLINTEFVPSPAYRAVRKVAHEERQVATPGRWGILAPAAHAGATWQLHLSASVPGGVYIAPSSAAVENGDSIKIPFRGTDLKMTLVPLTDTALFAGGEVIKARYYITVDGSSSEVASGLSRDQSGRAYIELPAGGQPTEVTVVRGLGSEFRTAEHELTITAGQADVPKSERKGTTGMAAPLPDARPVDLPGIGTITVQANRSYLLFAVITLLLALGIAIQLWALWRSRPQAEKAVARAGGGE